MRPSDRMPDEDFGPPPSLSEYFTYLGLGIACILAVCLLGRISDRLEDKSKVLSGFFVLLGLAALFGSWFFLLPLVAVWYTWVFVAGAVLLFFFFYSIWDHYQKKQYRREQELENKKWESLISFSIYPSQEKPNPSKKPIQYMLPGRLECKTENGMKTYCVDRKYEIEYNPYYDDPFVGEWRQFQFRYSEVPFHKDVLTYMYFNLPDDVLSLVDTEHRYARSRITDMSGDQPENNQVFEDDLPF